MTDFPLIQPLEDFDAKKSSAFPLCDKPAGFFVVLSFIYRFKQNLPRFSGKLPDQCRKRIFSGVFSKTVIFP
jgi:hypothetical protein